MQKWFSLEGKQVVQELNSDVSQGLSIKEVKQRLEAGGLNVLEEEPPPSLFILFRKQIGEPLVLILLVAAILAGSLGEIGDTVLILVIVVLNAVLGVWQEHKAEKALRALQALTKVKVKVRREGLVTQIAAENLVPGDLIFLETGDAVPADARLLEEFALQVNEAALTGESLPVEKIVVPLSETNPQVAEQKNMVFMGTVVTGGRAQAIVTGTGMQTELGRIADLLQKAPTQPTPLQVELAQLGRTLGWVALLIVALVLGAGLWQGEALGGMLLTAIALAVAAIPEGLPAVVTIVLALGVTRMSQRQAVIRKLPVVETLGVATYICSDKTGTLTKNEMTVTRLYVDEQLYTVTGSGYQPQGEIYGSSGQKFKGEGNLAFLLLGGVLNNDASLEQKGKQYRIIGDPTEGALLVVAAKAGLDLVELPQKQPRLAEIPFTAKRKMMTTFQQIEGELYALTKGAADFLLARCTNLLTRQGVVKLTIQEKTKLEAINQQLATEGQRVLALAFRKWPEKLSGQLEPTQIERDLTFVGFFALEDPLRQAAKQAVALCRQAGIKTVMITGDQQDTAVALAQKLAIWQEGGAVLTGSQLDRLSLQELRACVENTSVYARVSPEHKLKIVEALQAQKQVVAMTGDGVNDAPALKKADIGIAMGQMGTEVAKEAADLVLLDDNFVTIVSAVREGRAIYDNIRKAVQYLLSCNLGEVITIFTAIVGGMGSPLLPVQILWLNLVTDGAPALALGVEPPEKGIMSKKPRATRTGILAGGIGLEILIQGFVLGGVSFLAYWLALRGGRTISEAQTMAFLTMAFTQLVHSFNLRSRHESLFAKGQTVNYQLVGAFFLCAFLQLVVVFVPFLQRVFKTVYLQPRDWCLVLVFSVAPLLVGEVLKFFKRRQGTFWGNTRL